MNKRQLEQELKALGNRRRIEILSLLKKHGFMSVGVISSKIELSLTATSQHLSILLRTGLVENKQKGLTVSYRVSKSTSSILKAVLAVL